MTSTRQPVPASFVLPLILVVEDEGLIRLDIADHLRDCGYQVLEAGHAAEAIEILQADVPVGLVFSDVRMPGKLDGFDLAQWIRRHRPEVRVILTSGHAVQKAHELCSERPFLTKPYDPANVLRQIHRLLGQP